MSTQQAIEIPGARLLVETAGEGAEAVVLLHGLAGDHRVWDGLWEDLAGGRRRVRYDLRGFGGSVARDDSEFRHAEDLAHLLDTLGLERCDLVGVSLGGSVALNFALDHPERVRRLVLISPGITAWEWSADWRARWAEVVSAADAEDLAAARSLWWAHPLFDTLRTLPDVAASQRETLEAYSCAIWAGEDHEAPALPDLDRLPLLQAPVLLLTGSGDLPDFRLIADLIEAAAPDVRRIDVPGAGHMVNLERPAEVAAAIVSALS